MRVSVTLIKHSLKYSLIRLSYNNNSPLSPSIFFLPAPLSSIGVTSSLARKGITFEGFLPITGNGRNPSMVIPLLANQDLTPMLPYLKTMARKLGKCPFTINTAKLEMDMNLKRRLRYEWHFLPRAPHGSGQGGSCLFCSSLSLTYSPFDLTSSRSQCFLNQFYLELDKFLLKTSGHVPRHIFEHSCSKRSKVEARVVLMNQYHRGKGSLHKLICQK